MVPQAIKHKAKADKGCRGYEEWMTSICQRSKMQKVPQVSTFLMSSISLCSMLKGERDPVHNLRLQPAWDATPSSLSAPTMAG